MSLGNDPDRELVELCLDDAAERVDQGFARIYEKYQARIYNLGLRITGDHGAAGDVVQETFSTVFQKIHAFRGQSLFSSWLTRIGINFALERRRKDSRMVGLPVGKNPSDDEGQRDEAELADPRGIAPERRSLDREFEDEVHAVIQGLTSKYQTVVLLRYVEGLPYEEIADTLSCSVGTVKSRLNRAHRMLEGSLAAIAQKWGMRAGEPEDGS